MIYGEQGACPMSVHIQTRIVNFWSELVNCENSKLSSIIYKYAYLQHTHNGLEMPWIKAVKNILDSYGFRERPFNLKGGGGGVMVFFLKKIF
jgi:hypothetical protein